MDIPPEPLRGTKRQLGAAVRYLEAARLSRPEVNMVRAGIVARQAQVELSRARLFPDLGLGMSASWARAPEVADQLNPFVRDDANFLRYGFALVFRWQLDLVPGVARVKQAQAQLEELRQTERYALGGVGVEVETAYAQIVDATAREHAYGLAERTAKQWMIAIQQGIEVGTKEESDLVDPARQYALQRFSHLQAMMDVNLAWAQMAVVTGDEQFAPD
jgi:outer membrane protein TolC